MASRAASRDVVLSGVEWTAREQEGDMAKVLFINPMIREEDDPRHVPYGMALLAAIVARKGHQVQVYDANAWRLGDAALR